MPQQVQQQYAAKWEQFMRLGQTQDSAAHERRGFRRWLLLPYIAFVIPVDDPGVTTQLVEWQNAFRDRLLYDPQPPDRLHITLYYVGLVRSAPWLLLPNTWRRTALARLAEQARPAIEGCPTFELQIGPLNAFPNVLFAEVHNECQHLRALRVRLQRALPLRARPPSRWSFVPHVTLGLWGSQPAPPLVEALTPFRRAQPVTLRVDRVRLTIYTRDRTPQRRDMLHVAGEEIVATYHLTM